MNNDRKFVSGSSNFIMHYGILGQKWGVRRFQNPDGSYTEEGKERYAKAEGRTKYGRGKTIDKEHTNIYRSTRN